MKRRYWWFSCTKITCLVVSDENDRVLGYLSARIVRKFHGQHIKRLADWFRKLGNFRWKELDDLRQHRC